MAAEDARASTPAELRVLLDAASRADAPVRAVAVRALGRLERPDLVNDIEAHLDDSDPDVRAQAANALAQAVYDADGTLALDSLVARARSETNPWVRAVVARSLGRLRLGGIGLGRVENTFAQLGEISSTLLDASHAPGGGDPPDSALVQVALGLETFVRQNIGTLPASGDMKARLRELLGHGLGGSQSGGDAAHIRALAAMALGDASALDSATFARALADPDPDVRTDAARFLGQLPEATRGALVRRALADPSQHVRFEAVRVLGSRLTLDAASCSALEAEAVSDSATSVRLGALDALDRPCPGRAAQVAVLERIAASLDSANLHDWHAAAHAMLSLSAVAPHTAAPLLARFRGHRSPFVRAWAARAAGNLGNVGVLDSLAADPSDNVRTAAIRQLAKLRGHDADGVLLAQLERDDPQLLLTAAELLEGSPRGMEVAQAALSAFERISRARRETWRDPRRALLVRVGQLGDSSLAPRLEPYLHDYDPRVAGDVAGILSRWTGRQVVAHPEPLPRLPLPTPQALDTLARTTVVLHMHRGGAITIRLFPRVAPTNAFRFVRQARAGYFNGLTFHRVAPNFVLQGGSPGANEYQGSGPYTRDEVGLVSNWRGMVGLSTRGRDTGDGQIYIDLADNMRLDHLQTVWGEVVSGMDVVDAVQEGDVIDRAEVRTTGGGS
jgi:cyclophilin family peptidyl-prolyl cis-trans isomerase/HEAT repeat protein